MTEPGLEPGLFDPESSALITTPLRLMLIALIAVDFSSLVQKSSQGFHASVFRYFRIRRLVATSTSDNRLQAGRSTFGLGRNTRSLFFSHFKPSSGELTDLLYVLHTMNCTTESVNRVESLLTL